MLECELHDRLLALEPPPDPEAEERAWESVRLAGAQSRAAVRSGTRLPQAVSADRLARPRPRFRRRRAAVLAFGACALLAVGGALAVAKRPREALARWLGNAIGLSQPPHVRPLLAGLPGGGELLVESGSGPWIVTANGHRHRLGEYDGAGWSPHNLYVVAWRGQTLAALDPQGVSAWSRPTAGAVTVARWSPDGYRIAYLAGGSLWAIAGDGSEQHRLGGAAAAAPAWQPATGAAHLLAYVSLRGRVVLIDADSGRRMWALRLPVSPMQLLWSPDGTRLLALSAGRIELISSRGHVLGARDIAPETLEAAAFAHASDRFAVVARDPITAVNRLDLWTASPTGLRGQPQQLYTSAGTLSAVSWSPNDRWLLSPSPSADEWIFVASTGRARPLAVRGIAVQFLSSGFSARAAAAGPSAGGFPSLGGWQAPAGR